MNLKKIFGKTDDVIKTYLLVLVMSFLAAIFLICMTEKGLNTETEFLFGKLALVFSLGISLNFAFIILSQRIGKTLLFQFLGISILVLFYFLLPNQEKNFTEQYAFLIVPTFILSHLLVSFIAFFGQKKELNFWQYNKNLFINIFLTAVFTGVLIAGVQLAIVAVDQLFDFNFRDSFYRNPFIILSVFGSSFIFLLFNVNGLFSLEKNSDYPQILKFFTQYILIPLLLIYAVILYFYSAKILINWELPRGWVSYLVLAYSIVGILALLLVHPLKKDFSKSWVKIFSKIFYFTLIPLLVLLFMAIFTRVLQYGYTEARYFVLLLAIWLSAVVFYFIFYKNPTIKFVPISLFCFGLFALVFPYLNTFSVAKRSQKSELNKILLENNLLKNGKLNFEAKIADSLATEVSDKFEFLAKRKQIVYLEKLLNPILEKKLKKQIEKGDFFAFSQTIKGEFTNISAESYSNNSVTARKIVTVSANDHKVEISGYQYLFKAYPYQKNIINFRNNTLELIVPENENSHDLILKLNDKNLNLNEDLEHLFTENYKNKKTVHELSIFKTIDQIVVKIIFDHINRVETGKNTYYYYVNSESVIILIKEN